jgi:addiction module HigA family antidote
METHPHQKTRPPAVAQHPGTHLREQVLPGLHLSVSQAARELGVARQTLHRILAGEAAITPTMAARLEKLCGVSSDFWLRCQHRYDLQRARKELDPILRRIPPHQLSERILKKIGAYDGR